MGRVRVPSPTPSVDSDVPIPEIPQEGSNKPQTSGVGQLAAENYKTDDKSIWVIYVGNLHPYVDAEELHHLLDGGDDIRDIVIRTSRGCATSFIPEESIGPNDRSYASVLVIGWDRTAEIMGNYDPKKPPMLRGLPISLSLTPVDLPEVTEIVESALGLVPVNKTKRIARQETEKVIEDQARPLAGPSRRGSQLKPRYNPVRRSDRA